MVMVTFSESFDFKVKTIFLFKTQVLSGLVAGGCLKLSTATRK